jgi:hypothetical protein
VNILLEDDVDAPESVDFDGDVGMETDGDDEEEEVEEEDDEVEKLEKKEDTREEEEEEDENKDENHGKEPWTIGQCEMGNKSADDVDSMVDDHPIVIPEWGQQISEHTPWPHPLLPAPWPQTPDPLP